MKKIFSIILVIMLFCGILNVSAATNYCELFDKTLGCLSFVDDYGNENKAWSANSICYVTVQNIGFWDYFNESKSDMEHGMWECYSIPKAKLEATAKKLFDVKVDLTTVNYTGIIDITYDANTQTYDIKTKNAGGGVFYKVFGYRQVDNIYNVYLQKSGDGELSEEYALSTCTINNGIVKIISFAEISALPNASGLITPDKDDPALKPVATPSSSEPTSSEPVSSEPTSSEPVSSDIAEVDVWVEQAELYVSSEKGVFPKGTVLTATPISTAEKISFLNDALEKVAKTYKAYDITATYNNLKVQPDGKVYAKFNISSNFDINKVMVIYIAEDGSFEECNYTINKEEKYVTVELNHFSTYAVIEATDEYLNNNDSSSLWPVILIGLAIVLASGGFAAWYYLYYKKQIKYDEK